MKKTFKIIMQSLLIGSFVFMSSAADAENHDDIIVVANKQVAQSKISLVELRELFLKKRRAWGNAGEVVPINAKINSELRTAFQRRVLELSGDEEQRFWHQQRIMTGLFPPKPPKGRVLHV